MTTPDRSLEQRLAALERANVIRSARADLKARLKDDREWRLLALALLNETEALGLPAGSLDTMKVRKLLIAAPTIGAVKANRAMATRQISPSKTIAGLTERQRLELLDELYRHRSATITPAPALELARYRAMLINDHADHRRAA